MVPKNSPVATSSKPSRKKLELPTQDEVAQAKAKSPKKRGLTEAQILEKYPHAIAGTLQFDPEHNKQTIEADLECGHRERLFTSDLFQVKKCHECKKAKSKERLDALKAKKAEAKAAPTKVDKAPAKGAKAPRPIKATPAADEGDFVLPKGKAGIKAAASRLLK